jgi:hypothetical protein
MSPSRGCLYGVLDVAMVDTLTMRWNGLEVLTAIQFVKLARQVAGTKCNLFATN